MAAGRFWPAAMGSFPPEAQAALGETKRHGVRLTRANGKFFHNIQQNYVDFLTQIYYANFLIISTKKV